ncbi:MAG: hypothetical protein CO135_01105 [Candidatus Levybacteria bacterium CG_4_9_14_3_um_filter_35_16]|nr:MAG: hypothetical protein COW87_03040 [Candidatus Levybacteria bacterium CG22_combo_CG10-13_8_21_14_all_35_11]PIY93878.1 MAG: hypothetical protein COY68_04955 [Candidatus Levybacteria bacterium CG_4_10_14_0_8_um_filter_35_23]PIZ99591.1 MAG: hypothetical protein COX78_01670 [Candidatus Levybacteria bacterium CG_4_10_14_0_2_um_filter_35_8]PJA91464.1 MAG: hypothetical protein CO135_01105 [Candidatus Levybacteria bacterium CG_4_9_14_3_um_filter_35_16]PJC54683.1 MAG: hypothetical protein CO028_00
MGEIVKANFADKDGFSRRRKIFTPFQITKLSEIKIGQKYIPFYDGKKVPEVTAVSEPGPFPYLGQEISGVWFVVEAEIEEELVQIPVEATDFNIIPNEEGLYSNFAFLIRSIDIDKVNLGEVKEFKK